MMDTQAVALDLIRLIDVIAWPLVVLTLGLLFGGRLLAALGRMLPMVRSVSVGALRVDLASSSQMEFAAEGAVDVRHAGTSADINDSSLESFYAQFRDPTPVHTVIVDLGSGTEWLSSRLYIMSVLLRRMRGLQAIVFVETQAAGRRRFVGAARTDEVRWQLARACPGFENAYLSAASRVWGPFPGPSITIRNRQGRFGRPHKDDAEAAAQLLRNFLDEIQRPPVVPPDHDWTVLSSPAQVEEYAVWLDGARVEKIMGEALMRAAVRADRVMGRAADEVRSVLAEHPCRWIAVIGDDGRFEHLIDRDRVLAHASS